MLQRTKKRNYFLKTAIFFVGSTIFLLLILVLLFHNSFFKKNLLINPVVVNNDIEISRLGRLLLESGIAFSSIKLSSGYYEVELKDGGKVYISSKKNIRIQTSSLQAILKQLTINGKGFKLIDFRFDKPVIVFEK